MTDPYVVLGVSRTASDEEIKKKYRELARKYHPDNYANNPLADLAQEKMKQINEASFAVDEAVLFLDTHPDCAQAMQYYQSAVGARKAAMDAYQSRFGPLLVDDVIGNTWTWVTEKWPWEGGC